MEHLIFFFPSLSWALYLINSLFSLPLIRILLYISGFSFIFPLSIQHYCMHPRCGGGE